MADGTPERHMLCEGHVLIVEDDQPVANSLRRGLEALGRAVSVAPSASEALRLLEAEPGISVVVTDIRMPEASGLQLIEGLTALRAEILATEVIVITGHATTEDVTSAMRLGASDFLHKPFRLGEVDAAIARAASRAESRRAAARAKRREARASAMLADELAALQARLRAMLDGAHGQGEPDEEEREMARSAVSEALRAPLRAMTSGAALLDAAPAAAQAEEPLQQLRLGVERTVTAIELLEEYHRQPASWAPAGEALDLAQLLAAIGRTITARTGTPVLAAPAGLEEPVLVAGPRSSLTRAVTLCLEAAAELAPARQGVRYELGAMRQADPPCALVEISARPEGPEGRSQAGSCTHLATLRLLLARRMLKRCGGSLSGPEQPQEFPTIRMTLALAPRP